jgi:hypothetical protein
MPVLHSPEKAQEIKFSDPVMVFHSQQQVTTQEKMIIAPTPIEME